MLKPHHLLQLVPQRVQRSLQRLEKLIWYDRRELPIHWTGKIHSDHISVHEASKMPVKPVNKEFFWGKLFDQTWFRIDIPEEYRKDGNWYLDWREQGESTAYINGVPFAGFDVAHLSARLPKGTKEIWMESMCLETGIWSTLGQIKIVRESITPEGCRGDKATVVRRNDDAWHAYHDLWVLSSLIVTEHRQAYPNMQKPQVGPVPMEPLHCIQPRYRQLLRQVDDAISEWEKSGLTALRKALKNIYQNHSEGTMPMKSILTGHAHIDLVWLWPERCSESKAVHSFATANHLMDEYPEFRFGYSQTASYRAVGKRSPEMLDLVKKRIKQGKWEALGAMEVESDTLIPCGEALARCFTLGQEGFTELNGKASEVVWLPDVFGYSDCLPQLMQQTGAKYFFTTKLTWGSITHFPYSTFIWRGSDGTEVTAHVSQGIGYNQMLTPEQAYTSAVAHRQSDVHKEVLSPTGFGDGGGGVTSEICERARRMASLSGLPKVQWGSINDFFHNIEAIKEKLPTYDGELYLQYHRGVMTTHGQIKYAMRLAERSLQIWEAASCITSGKPIDKEAWRRVVFAQFHDYIPGSSIREVYEEAEPELLGIANNAVAQSIALLGGSQKNVPAPARKTKSETSAKVARSKSAHTATSVADASGAKAIFNPLPIEQTFNYAGNLYKIGPLRSENIGDLTPLPFYPVNGTTSSLGNGRIMARFDKKGRITTLNIDGKPIAIEGRLGDLAVYPDWPHMCDAWDLDRQTLSIGEVVETPAVATLETSQPNQATLSFKKKLTEKSSVTIRYILEAESPVLRVEYDVDWHEERGHLRALFPTQYRGKEARFGSPYGSTLRSQKAGQPYDEAQWEVAGNRWATLSDDSERSGLAVITEAKYGWSAKDGSLQLSLLRSASVTMDSHNPTLRKPSTMVFSDLGHSKIRIAIGSFSIDKPRNEQPAMLADSLFTGVIPHDGSADSAGLCNIRGGESVAATWAKPVAKGEWILRLNETLGQRGTLTLELEKGWSASYTDLSEVDGDPLKENTLDFTPYQLLSIRIRKNKRD